jgi:hypothetical protein
VAGRAPRRHRTARLALDVYLTQLQDINERGDMVGAFDTAPPAAD